MWLCTFSYSTQYHLNLKTSVILTHFEHLLIKSCFELSTSLGFGDTLVVDLINDIKWNGSYLDAHDFNKHSMISIDVLGEMCLDYIKNPVICVDFHESNHRDKILQILNIKTYDSKGINTLHLDMNITNKCYGIRVSSYDINSLLSEDQVLQYLEKFLAKTCNFKEHSDFYTDIQLDQHPHMELVLKLLV